MLKLIKLSNIGFNRRATILIGGMTCIGLYSAGYQRFKKAQFASLYENLELKQDYQQEYLKGHVQSVNGFWNKMIQYGKLQLRFLQLILTFTPLVLFFPFALLFKSYLYKYWLRLLIKSLEIAGPLWMKLGQWASHRGDVFGYEVTSQLSKLRDSATPHNYYYTKKQFEDEFKQKIEDVFDSFDKNPIASGSIGQVHIAYKNGVKYAVKVRHPRIVEKLELDLKILYIISNILSSTQQIFRRLAMPVTFQEFSVTLMNQADLSFEAKNLQIFEQKFKDSKNVIFPKILKEYVSKSVIVETFEEGVSLSDFMKLERTREHRVAANLGLKAFYKMLIYDNFIHADLHSGNILVRIKDNDTSKFDQFKNMLEEGFYDLVEYAAEQIVPLFEKFVLKKPLKISILEKEKIFDEQQFWNFLRQTNYNQKNLDLIFIDPGMVTILNQNDRINFIKIIMFVALRQPKECGQLMLSLASYNTQLKEEKKQKFLKDIEDLFGEVCNAPLAKMDLGLIFKGMLEILRSNGLAVEGHFATLLTNMMILEGIGKELDPKINIVSKAASFLLQIRTIDSTINELMNISQ
ncbi:unnamed protein product [Paramecium primaurelia]|uniref:ABC1 atypical kinase-like domain-containing protein n=1 Tax=Paramecium primaurelia TaxID=5886 RepID=A0A8S1MFC1_PARPR|nr:unnamed protein product [Paramecium primaurelia]